MGRVATISEYISQVDLLDKSFVGTVALRSEELALPDGSKSALGIDGAHWVLVYQAKAGDPFQVFEYNQHTRKINLDKKPGSQDDIARFKKLVRYFLTAARVDDLVTILPPHPEVRE